MPELPEVEILVRHLRPLLQNRTVHDVTVRRARVLGVTTEAELSRNLVGAKFTALDRRGKYLVFALRPPGRGEPVIVIGHLGMTGRMYGLPKGAAPPKHAAVILDLGRFQFIFEDTRYFGRFTLDPSGLARLGPEPLGPDFTVEYFHQALKRSTQAVKVRLLDQQLVAGVGNIYASEALFRAGISPRLAARQLKPPQIARLWQAVRDVLDQAISTGSTIPLDFSGLSSRDRLFYYGAAGGESGFNQERLLVYDRRGQPCSACGTPIRRLIQAARSTFFCPTCQRTRGN